jgi:hypothetical protein
MKSTIFYYVVAGLITFCIGDITAQDRKQDSKERGNTDYTNNRSRGKSKNTDNRVNTDKNTPIKIHEQIAGSWTIEAVNRGNKDVTDTDTLSHNQRLEFTRESRYISYSGNEKIDSGAYRVNESQSVLYLESETGEKPIEWKISFSQEGTMTLKQKEGTAHGESFSYVYRKITNAAATKR